MQRSLLLFENSIHSKVTLKSYTYALHKFIEYFKLRDYDSLAEMQSKMLQEMIEDYVMYMKSRSLSRSSINTPINALQLFCESNDVDIKWKKIRRMAPQQKKRTGKKAYSTKDIQNMLKFEPKLRNKVIIHILTSTGIRVGAIIDIKVGHLAKMPDGCMAVTIYEGDIEEYTVFLTPEATEMLSLYLNKRKANGELLDNNSPLIREQYFMAVSKAKPLSTRGIQATLERIVRRAGLRTGTHGERRDTQLGHGFRKRFNTVMKTTDGMNLVLAEKMLGHSIQSIPLDETYLDATREKLFAEFKKAIPELTIDDSARKQAQLDQKEKENSELQKKVNEIEQLKKEQQRMKKQYDNDQLDSYRFVIEQMRKDGIIPK